MQLYTVNTVICICIALGLLDTISYVHGLIKWTHSLPVIRHLECGLNIHGHLLLSVPDLLAIQNISINVE